MAQSERAARLLLRALDSLKPAERRVVLQSLLTGSVGRVGPQAHGPSVVTIDEPRFAPPRQGRRQMEQPLLVRLPSSLHARFRKWTNANGFSMAAVARGLIERFLDEQERSASA
jgi:hypothetical protein